MRLVRSFFVIGLVIVLLGSLMAFAEETTSVAPSPETGTETTEVSPPEADETDTQTEVVSTTPTAKDQNLADSLSKAYQITVTAQDVASLRSKNSLGYGEIGLCYGFAAKANKSTSEIVAMRAQDMGWGEIAKSLGFKVSDVMNKNAAVLKDAKMANENRGLKRQVTKEEKAAGKAQSEKSKSESTKSSNNSSKSGSSSGSHGGGGGNGSSGGHGGGGGNGSSGGHGGGK